MRVKKQKETSKIENITELLAKYSEEYNSVFVEDFGEDLGVFIFHSIGRKDFKDLVESKVISNFAKEEVLCEACTLYPKNFDFENCEAGLPSKLSKLILERSLLDDVKNLESAIHYCRDKIANDLDEQITCVIHEAFPEFTVEEIANWDIAKTAEYMAKSEFILHNLRGVPITPVERTTVGETAMQQPRRKKTRMEQALEDQEADEQRENARPTTFEDDDALSMLVEQETKNQQEIKAQTIQSKPKNKTLIPKDLSTLKKLAPGIDWEHDSVSQRGINAFIVPDGDTTPIAMRGTDDEEYTQDLIPEALRDRFKVIGKI